MRSFLNVPLDPASSNAYDAILASGADCLILEAPDNIEIALSCCTDMKRHKASQPIYLRLKANASDEMEDALAHIAASNLDGLLLDHCESGRDVTAMDVRMSAAEAIAGRKIGSLGIIAQVTDTATALFGLGSYKDASPRLKALTWDADLTAKAIGATVVRTRNGSFIPPCQTARDLCLIGAAAAGIQAIDTACPDHTDLEAFGREAMEAKRDGFQGKWATCEKQVTLIQQIF
ncbi:aldolase/citrate lyase family protein [uncultured Cohaesibacter sp.]|uniref:aldolase/citrate lyase family protein n=1 Tax=uncultured Cohaesibacter sp. TaxID=1002546 RepID=UPI0029C729E5|nr:aldolase/citrate lyase family protein [uncultured Cohaesibacter sp.]